MSRNQKILSIVVAIFIIAIGGYWLRGGFQKEYEERVIKIGTILPLTGNFAQIGEPKKEAFLLAADDINLKGGINGKTVEIVLEDSKGDPKEGVTILQKKIDIDKLKVFYVDLTPVALAAVPVADRNQVVMFAGSAHPTITNQSKWVFRFFPSGQQEAEMLNEYLVGKGVKKIFILYSDETYGEEMKNVLSRKFQEKSGEVIGSEGYAIAQRDFRSILTKIKSTDFEKLVLIGYGVTFPTILEQLNELQIPSHKVIGNIGFIGTPQIPQLPASLTNDIVFVGPSFVHKSAHLDENPNVKKFVEAYNAKYGKNPNFVAAYAYDAIQILGSALKSGSDPESLRKVLLTTKDFEGVTGKITIRENGDSYTDMMLAKYLDGKIVPLEE